MPKHIFRLLGLLIAFLVFAYAAIVYLTDPSFYRFGHYRADVVPELAAGEPQFRGPDYCQACHAERHSQWSSGAHLKVKCEICHGPAGQHPATGKLPVPADPTLLCTGCHEAMPARPATQPQIVVSEHPFPHQQPIACTTCHNPHAPRLGAPAVPAVGQPTPRASPPASQANAEAPAEDKPAAASPPIPEVLPKTSKALPELSEPLSEDSEASSEPSSTLASATVDLPESPAGAQVQASAAACSGCHGTKGEGVGAFPALAGMPELEFIRQMKLFKSGERPSPLMAPIAEPMSDEVIAQLAEYYANLTGNTP